MMNKILVVGIVAIMIVAGFLFVFPTDDDDSDMDATAFIYVQNVDTGDILEAEMDLSGLRMAEQMMMSISGEARTMDFTGSISALSQNGHYQIWIVTKAKVTATDDIASLTKITCQFSGTPGAYSSGIAPDHVTSTVSGEKLWTLAGSASAISEKTNPALGTEYTFDQSSVPNGKFVNWYSSVTKVTAALNGDRIDGASISCTIAAYAIDDSGATVVSTSNAVMKISVASWSQSALSIAITSIGVGGFAAV